MTTALQTNIINLGNLNVHLVVDRSGSMGPHSGTVKINNRDTGKTRWDYSAEVFGAFAIDLGAYDDDGIDITFFNGGTPMKLTGVKPGVFLEEWKKITPQGGTVLSGALGDAIDLSLARIKKTNGEKTELIVVLLDGELDDADQKAVIGKIVFATKQIKDRSQLGILFIQVGDDAKAKKVLDTFDNDMRKHGAVHDIVSSKPIEALEGQSVQQLVDAAFSQ